MKTLSVSACLIAVGLASAFGCAAPSSESADGTSQASRERYPAYPDTTICGTVSKSGGQLSANVTRATERSLSVDGLRDPEDGQSSNASDGQRKSLKLFMSPLVTGAASLASGSVACVTGALGDDTMYVRAVTHPGPDTEYEKCGVVRVQSDSQDESIILYVHDGLGHDLSAQDGSSLNTLRGLNGKPACIKAQWGTGGAVDSDKTSASVASSAKVRALPDVAGQEIPQN